MGICECPLSAVGEIEVLEDAHRPAGIKVGMRIPGVVEVATIRGRRRKLFAAVHHDTPRGVRVCLGGVGYDEWIVGCADPEAVAATLSEPG